MLLALDTESGKPLYLSFVKSETVKDYEDAVVSIEKRGYVIRGLIIDGKKSLFKSFWVSRKTQLHPSPLMHIIS